MKEAELLRQLQQWLTIHGHTFVRLNSGAVVGEYKGTRRLVRFNTMPGISDLLVLLPGGRCLWVEAKGAGGRLRPDQKVFLERMASLGHATCVAYSVDDLMRAFAGLGAASPPAPSRSSEPRKPSASAPTDTVG